MSKLRPQKLNDIQYELQLLFGSDGIIHLIESWDKEQVIDGRKFGNIVNYFKDCIYLHSRNLLNILTNQRETEIGTIPACIHSELYEKLKPAIEVYVTHLGQARDNKGRSNVVNDTHLSDFVHKLSDEVKLCFSEWINSVKDKQSKAMLQDIMDKACKDAVDDREKMMRLLGVKI